MKSVILVTGGVGFLGSHLCMRLIKEGHNVVAIDDLSSSSGDNLQNLCSNIGYPSFEFIKYDVTHSLTSGLLGEYEIGGIFNLACPASPQFYQYMPIQTTLTCVVGAYNALSLAQQRKCKILQTSTSEVYGDPEISPQIESYRGRVNCFGPRACYDEGKRAAEALFYDFRKEKNTDIRVVRIFNTYGPHMLPNDGRVVSNFIMQALQQKPITVYGDGNQSRSFCYVDDLIDAIMIVWNSDYTSPVNIGNPGEFTMLELAQKVIGITNSKSEITFHPLPIDDPLQRRPDITLAKSLGWSGPKVPLDEGLRNTVQYLGTRFSVSG